jgi:single-stranded-DNA-specific exonuclease
MAAGLSLRAEQLESFREAFTAHCNERLAPEELAPSLGIDCSATLAELDAAAVTALSRLSPFGRGNPRPALLVRDAEVASPPRVLKERHLKVWLREHRESGPREIEAIWWGQAEQAPRLARGVRVDVVLDPKINAWGGRSRVEAEIADIALV